MALLLILGLWVVVDAILIAYYVSKKRRRESSLKSPSQAPGQVVRNYFDAINSRDYDRAWSLGGRNLVGGPYQSYVETLSVIVNVSATIYAIDGDSVTLRYDATQKNGTRQRFSGVYTVRNGTITEVRVAP
jgi:ketosteroid isomerase-like protein